MEVPAQLDVKTKAAFNMDAFSDGQVSSKLWLCDELEKLLSSNSKKSLTIAVYGSWQGLLPFMLLTRNQVNVSRFDLYDIDPQAQEKARQVLDHWRHQNQVQIHFHVTDCNEIRWNSPQPDVIINTSCEHMESLEWWSSVPDDTLFCLQTTDMPHPTHVNRAASLDEWKASLNIKVPTLYEGSRFTEYATFSFHRWMLIGRKRYPRTFLQKLSSCFK